MNILYVPPPFPIGILYIGGYMIIVRLLLLCVFRMILNKGRVNIPQEYLGSVNYFSYLCSMNNIDNKQLRKLLRDKRFTTTVRNWGSKSTTYEYRITNIKMSYGKENPTTSTQNWRTTIINLVCSGQTTEYRTKKRKPGGPSLTDEERIDRRYNPIVKDCMAEYGEWYYSLGWGGDPRRPRRDIRYSLLNDEYDYGRNTRRASDLRDFLKLVGISGEIKIGTIKLVPVTEV